MEKTDELLKFKEIKGMCLGYSNQGTNRNAIGKELGKNILKTMKELQKSGEADPVIFELLNVFQGKVGCDRVSDLLSFLRTCLIRTSKEIRQEIDHIIIALKIQVQGVAGYAPMIDKLEFADILLLQRELSNLYNLCSGNCWLRKRTLKLVVNKIKTLYNKVNKCRR